MCCPGEETVQLKDIVTLMLGTAGTVLGLVNTYVQLNTGVCGSR